MSAAARSKGKISRVTFNAAVKPLIPVFGDSQPEQIYSALRSYLRAFLDGARQDEFEVNLANPTLFRATMMLFPEVARRVKDRFGADYSVEKFSEVITPMFGRLKATTLKKPGNSLKSLHDTLLKALQTDFTL
jgi:hypothetical protein